MALVQLEHIQWPTQDGDSCAEIIKKYIYVGVPVTRVDLPVTDVFKCVTEVCLKYFSENHTMVKFEINTPRSNKILPSVLTKYSSRRREYLVRTRGSILLLRGVFIKIFIEWWSRKTPRRQPRGFSCHHEMNIAPN